MKIFSRISDEMIAAVSRHLITALGVWLVSQSYITQSQAEGITGALMALVAASWSAYKANKNKQERVELKQEIAVKEAVIEKKDAVIERKDAIIDNTNNSDRK